MIIDSPTPKTKDRFPWALLIGVFLLQATIGVFFTVNQRREDIAQTEENLVANLQVLESLLNSSLQSAQYQEIAPLLTTWVDLYRDKVDHLDLTSGNGFVFFQHAKKNHTGNSTDRIVPIAYSYQGNAVLTVHWCQQAADRQARKTLILLGGIQLITTLALVFFLRLATQRKRDARMLAARARELVLSNRDLQREMEQREVIEKNLAREKEQLQVTLRSLGEGVVRIDDQGTILLANAAAREMFGCQSNQCSGQFIDEALNLLEENAEYEFKIFESGYLQESSGNPKELVLVSPAKKLRFVALACSPITAEQDEIIGWVLVFRDITETKHLEQEQRRNSMLQALGVLAGGIAHDFNNILMAISGNLNLAMEMSTGDSELDEIISSAEKAADRAADLTRQLLTFAKGGSPILDATAIDDVIRESADFVTHGADLKIQYEFEEGLYPVFTDRHQIGQVIQNLVINARQAMPTGGLLHISCANVPEAAEGEAPMVRIQVTDQGAGIPEADLEHIFDPYYSTKSEGNGLGLAVVHSIITRHQGRIEVQSGRGKGTTFTIFLPASSEPLATPKIADTLPAPSTGLVMVMDDDKAVLQITGRMLRQLGFEVVEANHGAKAITLFQEHLQAKRNIELVILDLTVPRGMGGVQTIEKLLSLDPDCKVIVSSGYSDDPVMGRYKEYGFKAALIKPFNLRQLGQVMGQVLGQS